MNLSKTFESTNPLMDTSYSVSTSSGDAHSNAPYEGNYQVNISSTNFELENITSSYNGLMRIYRLIYIAEHCSTLRTEALYACLKTTQETHFTSLYKQVRTNKRTKKKREFSSFLL